MNKTLALILVSMVTLTTTSVALSKEETQVVLSRKCDAKQIKKLAGDAAIKVKKGSWESSYNVTLDTSKMTFNALLQKMAEARCN